MEKHYTPAEVAAKLKCSSKQVIRLFGGEDGVINIGTKDKRLLRIPESVLNRALTGRRIA